MKICPRYMSLTIIFKLVQKQSNLQFYSIFFDKFRSIKFFLMFNNGNSMENVKHALAKQAQKNMLRLSWNEIKNQMKLISSEKFKSNSQLRSENQPMFPYTKEFYFSRQGRRQEENVWDKRSSWIWTSKQSLAIPIVLSGSLE